MELVELHTKDIYHESLLTCLTIVVRPMMLLIQQSFFLFTFSWLILARDFLPEAPDVDAYQATFEQKFDHVIAEYDGLKKRDTLITPREYYPASELRARLVPQDSPALVKRILQGRQQQCDAGYSLCRSKGTYRF